MYAQLDFTNNRYKQVNLIGNEDVGITPELIQQYPSDFINLESREDIPENSCDWYYDTETDTFITISDFTIPVISSPYEPTNAEIAQMISDLYADLVISEVILE